MLTLPTGTYYGKIVDAIRSDGLIFSRTFYDGEVADSPWHYHQNSHISFSLQGGCIETRAQGKFERLAGDIIYMYAGEAHQNNTRMFPCKNLNLEIERSFLTRYKITEADINWAVTHNPAAKFLLLKLYGEFLYKDSSLSATANMLLLDLFCHKTKLSAKERWPPWVNIIEQRLHDCWDEPVCLEELSLHACVHPVTISKNFHRYFSCTLGEYSRQLKIEKAIALMRSSSHSLTEIAFQCGFSDQSHFIRVFKNLTGFLPKGFRQL